MKKIISFIIVLSFLFAIYYLSNKKTKQPITKNSTVTVSILPQKYFVEKIAGSTLKVNVMIPPGKSPATYDPTPSQMKLLNNSKIYFRIGYIPFEFAWIDKIKSANKNMKIIDTSVGINLIKNGKSTDPHIWITPREVKIEIKNIYNSLIENFPENKELYTQNYKSFIIKLDNLDKLFTDSLKNITNKKFIVYHPVWSYFARDYNLKQIPIEIDGKSPSAKNMQNIINISKKNRIKVVFVQLQFPIEDAKTIADAINGKVIQIDPLSEDWLENSKKTIKVFEEVLGGKNE
ncbi:metal ABC transporter solute-binding protein, Zn/Mn family [Haliovirga abyssi]|uniref:ABC transporter substrate-binding protein n=1 Tax=Haliovirga abyssi TaxID=2996794 RepID=A0AAU9D6B4_9FUSO|nr:zinc ABC transporter substrate-binding protein [Haliovirga abyssi]BDU51529.1 ABC transporter substrate-binding protein [Haliovirga abyssi]